MNGEVELDIFSGRPNPRWQLTPAEQSELASLLRELEEVPPVPEQAGILGYRGVRVVAGPLGTVYVTAGVLRSAAGTFRDAGRRVERWLLATGRDRLDSEIWRAISSQID